MLKLITLASLISFTACATDDTTTDPTGDDDTAPPTEISRMPERTKTDGIPDICERLPKDGPCSLACAPERLVDRYVPAGTCAVFECTPEGGEPFETGGCNN